MRREFKFPSPFLPSPAVSLNMADQDGKTETTRKLLRYFMTQSSSDFHLSMDTAREVRY